MRILFDDICSQGTEAHPSLAAVALGGKLARSEEKVLLTSWFFLLTTTWSGCEKQMGITTQLITPYANPARCSLLSRKTVQFCQGPIPVRWDDNPMLVAES